ncbi:MAG: hypothetical protein KGH71_06150, partial [Candidatus Micrarchaeota archaeon]|nr:hypothetical protein [Candidatus Micrarchaeota archaeon]
LGKASGRDSPELRPGQKKKLFSIKDEKYIMFLKESGLDANLSEYKTFSGQDGKRAEKEVVGPQKLILGVKNATASGNKDEAIRLAREIDLRMIGKGDYSQIRMQVRDSFLKEVFGISGYFNSGCQTMVENFFFLKEMGAPEPLSIIAKNPGCLNLPLSKKWGILNYEVMELKFPIKSIWESPYKLNFQLERVLPRHMYYVKKGKPSLFGCTNAAPLGITKMDQKGDENFIDYLSKAGMNVNLEEYLIFKDGPAVKAKLEIYLNAKGPLDETKQKIKQYLQRLEDQKSNFPLKRE